MLSLKELLLGVVAPAIIGLIVMLIAHRPWRRRSGTVGKWGGAVGVALAYIVAHIGLYGPPQFKPAPVEHWLVWIALSGMVIGVLESYWRGSRWGRLLWRAVAAAGGVWLLVRLQVINNLWTSGQAALWTAGLAGGVVFFWSIADALTQRIERQGGGGGAALTLSAVTGFGAAIIVLDGQTLVVGQFAGALSIALLACAAVAWWQPRAMIGRGGAAVVGLLAPMLWIDAWMWAELGAWHALAIAISPALAFAGDLPGVHAWRGWVRTLVRVGAVSLPLLTLVGLEVKQALDEQKAQQELGY